MSGPRVAIVSDLREERWHSMDLVSELLVAGLECRTSGTAPWTRSSVSADGAAPDKAAARGRARLLDTTDRVINRYWDYPRWLDRRVASSPCSTSWITATPIWLPGCHWAGRSSAATTWTRSKAVVPGARQPSACSRAMGRRLLDGLRAAARVVCGTEATRQALVSHGLVPAARVSVVPSRCTPRTHRHPTTGRPSRLAALCAGAVDGAPDLLHVGSTIPRKRIDLVLEIFAEVRRRFPGARLLRVGGPLSSSQLVHAARLGVADAVVTLPFLDRRVLASVYRRAALVLHRRSVKGSGCRWPRRWPAARPWCRATFPRCAKPEAAGPSIAASAISTPGRRPWAPAAGTADGGNDWAWRGGNRALAHGRRFTLAAHALGMTNSIETCCRTAFDWPLARAGAR